MPGPARTPVVATATPPRSGSDATVAARIVAAVVVVFAWWGPHVAKFLSLDTRLRHQLQPQDFWYLIGTIVALALLGVAFSQFLRRLGRPWVGRLLDHVFVVALGAGLLANLWYHTRLAPGAHGYQIAQFGAEVRSGWFVLLLLVGYSYGRRSTWLVCACRRLCQILFPGVVIVIVQMLSSPTYSTGRDPIPHGPPPAGPEWPPVYLMVFDEWSYARTFDGGEVRPHLKHIRSLADQAAVFHDARAPNGHSTVYSMAGLLFEKGWPVGYQENTGSSTVYFEHGDRRVHCQSLQSLFAALPEGYRRILIGYSLPYRNWLGDQIDVYRSHPYYGYYRGETPWANIGVQALQAMQWWTDPWSAFAYGKLHHQVEDVQLLDTYRNMEQDVLEVIRTQPRNSAVLVHYLLPHLPNITDEQGRYLGHDRFRDSADEAAYERNLAYADVVLGRLIQEMKQTGVFDKALLIVTSDHSWRVDPQRESETRPDALAHVPLLVKAPGQTRGVAIDQPFENHRIGGLIRELLRAPEPLAALHQFVNRAETAGAAIGQVQPRD